MAVFGKNTLFQIIWITAAFEKSNIMIGFQHYRVGAFNGPNNRVGNEAEVSNESKRFPVKFKPKPYAFRGVMRGRKRFYCQAFQQKFFSRSKFVYVRANLRHSAVKICSNAMGSVYGQLVIFCDHLKCVNMIRMFMRDEYSVKHFGSKSKKP